MKKKLIFAALAGVLFFSTACSSDDDGNSSPSVTVQEVVSTVSSGTWKITSYIDSGTNKTNNFTNYNFTFGASSVLTATNGTNTYQGVWSVMHDNSNDDNPGSDIDFNIAFTTPVAFADLTDDWDILERTSTKIRLVDVSGGNGGTDYLTFEKNTQ